VKIVGHKPDFFNSTLAIRGFLWRKPLMAVLT
jgi:hypothetical protein